MSHITRSIIGLSYFLFLSIVSYAQAVTGASTSTSQNNNGFSIGFYGGPNTTLAKPINVYIHPQNDFNAGNGADYTLEAKLNLYKALFFSTGIWYERQAYHGNNDIGTLLFLPQFLLPLDYSISEYNIGIPLILGYGITKKKWGFSAGAGIEFYYNFEGKLIFNTSPTITYYFFKGRNVSTLDRTSYNYFWNPVGAFGILQARIDYKMSPKFSISCIPVFQFTDPFAEDTHLGSFLGNSRVNTFSLNVGFNYFFPNKHLKDDYHDGNDEKDTKISLGFSIIPNDVINKITPPSGAFFLPHTNTRFSFSYAMPFQYDISTHIALESGIVIDNFNSDGLQTNLLIGLPIVVKYYFPLNEDQSSSLYIGAGCHFDYPTNLGWLYDPAHAFILPLALGKVGYRLIIGKCYYFDANVGYEVSFNNIQSSEGNRLFTGTQSEITGLPRYIFSSVDFGCRL